MASRNPSRCSTAPATGRFISKPTRCCTKTICRKSARRWKNIWTDERVEALAFDYLHFYGNKNTIAWSPGWYRSEVRIIRNTIPAWSSEALFFNVVDGHKKSRYPRAAHTGATIFHYGWVRSEAQMNLKSASVQKYWDDSKPQADGLCPN